MADLPVDNQDAGDVAETEVVAGLLLGPRQASPEAIESTMGDLNHQRRGGWRSEWPGGGSGVAVLCCGGMCGVSPRATAASRHSSL
jgi:hypothetical protein